MAPAAFNANTTRKITMLRENELSIVGKTFFVLLIGTQIVSAVSNIGRGEVIHPSAFVISLIGLVFFVVAKTFVIRKGVSMSFGSELMSPMMGNFYRLGYWLMVVGVILTFA